MNPATTWARVLVDELLRGGVRAVVIAPGSRSTALALEFARRESRGDLRIFSLVDERGAAYFALGHARTTRAPAAVLCTSGTAAANLLPAAVEANLSRVPLILLTADRPASLRNVGANQTIDQRALFGVHARGYEELPEPSKDDAALRVLRHAIARAVSTATAGPAGPVHVNAPFVKPFEPSAEDADVGEGISDAFGNAPGEMPGSAPGGERREPLPDARGRGFTGRPRGLAWIGGANAPALPEPRALASIAAAVRASRRGLIVCGPRLPDDDFADAVQALGEATGYPILADPLSNVRFARHARGCTLAAYDAFLAAGFGGHHTPDLVLRFGAFPTSASLEAHLAQARCSQVLVDDDGGPWRDPVHAATHHVHADSTAFARSLADAVAGKGAADPGWLASHKEAESLARTLIDDAFEARFVEGAIAPAVVGALEDDATLYVSSSMPARDLDRFAPALDTRVRVHANRGASGIDGVVSSAFGAAAASSGPTVLLTGDLAAYHDLNGFLAARRENLDLTVVLVNNDGGGIFEFLPVRDHEPAYSRLFRTSHGLDFSHAARLFSLEHVVADDAKALEAALHDARRGGSRLVEVRTNAREHALARRELTAKLRVMLEGCP